MHRAMNFLDRLAHRRALRYWVDVADGAVDADLDALRDLRASARQTRRAVGRVLHIADGRLALPLLGSNAMKRLAGADWMWRPELWRGPIEPCGIAGIKPRSSFGSELTIHHDCPLSEITFRQYRNKGQGDLAPFGAVLDVLGFEGSYLSLLVDLPKEAVETLTKRHIFRVEMIAARDRDITLYARMNVKNGPNTEQIAAKLEDADQGVMADFDLGFTKINEKRVERLWLEIFFEAPAMSCVTLRDLTISRRPRAEV